MLINLKNNNSIWGFLLIALGAFFLLQVTGVFGVLSDLFWSIAFAAAGAVFLYVFLTGLHTRWWAAIPGFTLMGLAATVFYGRFAPPFLSDIRGAVFLGSIAISFFAIFFTNRHLWWALIPGGALLSVAAVALVTQAGLSFLNPASVLFVGLGMTFAVVGLMSTYLNMNLRWAYIPAAILLLLGLVIFSPFAGMVGLIVPLALIGLGAYVVLRRSNSTLSATTEPVAPVIDVIDNNGKGTASSVTISPAVDEPVQTA